MTYLRDIEVANRYGVHRSAIWRWVKTEGFPAPLKLTPGASRWRLADIEAWESARQSDANL